MIENIRQRLEMRPFEPFTVVTSAGKPYLVASPEHAGFNPKGTRVTIYFDDDSFVYLSALHIAAVEQGTPTNAAA